MPSKRSKMGSVVPLVEVLPDKRLPSEGDVLGHFLYLRSLKSTIDNLKTANVVIDSVLDIWDKAYIPSQEKRNIIRMFFAKKGLLQR